MASIHPHPVGCEGMWQPGTAGLQVERGWGRGRGEERWCWGEWEEGRAALCLMWAGHRRQVVLYQWWWWWGEGQGQACSGYCRVSAACWGSKEDLEGEGGMVHVNTVQECINFEV